MGMLQGYCTENGGATCKLLFRFKDVTQNQWQREWNMKCKLGLSRIVRITISHMLNGHGFLLGNIMGL